MPVIRKTALSDMHVQLGAFFTDFAGWDMPVRYTSDSEEHRAVRKTAGVFDLSHMGQIELNGSDAGQVLDVAFVSWISKLSVGKAKYTMMCDASGGVLDDLVVYRTGEQQFLIVANASNHSAVIEQLHKQAAAFDTTITDRAGTNALLAVQGPSALAILQQVTDAPIDTLKYFSILHGEIQHVPVEIARTGYTGEDGFEIYVNAVKAVALWTTILNAGEPFGLKPAGLACRDTLRLEAGMPLYGHELSRSLTPFEAGAGRLVAFDKPSDFVGRAALEERSSGSANQVLVGLELDGQRIAREKQTVLVRGTDEPVGVVTSGAPSPTLGHPIAMAYVDPDFSMVGTDLTVDVRGRRERARVVSMPFYRRSR